MNHHKLIKIFIRACKEGNDTIANLCLNEMIYNK